MECADIGNDLRDIKMNAINTLLKTNQSFGTLVSSAEWMRKKDRIRKQNMRRDPKNELSYFHHFHWKYF